MKDTACDDQPVRFKVLMSNGMISDKLPSIRVIKRNTNIQNKNVILLIISYILIELSMFRIIFLT